MGLLLIVLEQQRAKGVSHKVIVYSIRYYLALAVRVVSCLRYAILLMSVCPLIVFGAVAHSYAIHTSFVHFEKIHLLIVQATPGTFLAVSFTAVIRLGLAFEAATESAHRSVIAPCLVDLLYNYCKIIE